MVAFPAARLWQALPAGQGRTSSLRCGRSTLTCGSPPAGLAAAGESRGAWAGGGVGWVDEGLVDLAGDVALEGADGLLAGLAFGGAAGQVLLGAGVVLEAGDDDPPDRVVGLPVAAAVEAVALVLA